MEKILNTRIALKIDTYANWTLSNETTQANKTNADFVLKHGEIGLCEIKGDDSIQTVDPNGLSKTQVLFKVGDGVTAFKNLQWASALAADVYSWAKQSETDFLNWIEEKRPTVTDTDFDTRYDFEIVDHALKVTKTLWTLGVAGEPEEVGTYDFITADELAAITLTAGTNINIDEDNKINLNSQLTDIVSISGHQDEGLTLTNKEININGNYGVGIYAQDHINISTPTTGAIALEANTIVLEGDVAINNKSLNNVIKETVVDEAGKVSNALTVTVGDNDPVTFDGSAEANIVIPAQTDYSVTMTEDTTDSTIAKRYIFSQCGSEIGRIDLAKELVVSGGSVGEVTVADTPYAGAKVGDKYIELIIANQETPIYVPAKDLVDIYTAKALTTETTDEVQVAISNTNEISATLVDGKIAKTKLAAGVQESLNKADSALQANDGRLEGTVSYIYNTEDLTTFEVMTKDEIGIKSGLGAVSIEGPAGVSIKASSVDIPMGAVTVSGYDINNIAEHAAKIEAPTINIGSQAEDRNDVINLNGTININGTEITELIDTESQYTAAEVADMGGDAASNLVIDQENRTIDLNSTLHGISKIESQAQGSLSLRAQNGISMSAGGASLNLALQSASLSGQALTLEGQSLSAAVGDSFKLAVATNAVGGGAYIEGTYEEINFGRVPVGEPGNESADDVVVKINGKSIKSIATSGNVKDLVQTEGDVLVFNCGTSTTVI